VPTTQAFGVVQNAQGFYEILLRATNVLFASFVFAFCFYFYFYVGSFSSMVLPPLPQDVCAKERFDLEKYVNLPNFSREYIIDRIKSEAFSKKKKRSQKKCFFFFPVLVALGSDSLLAKYIWNAGGNWLDRPWTKDLPCDAQIVMHILRSFMDEILVGEDPKVHRGLPFTNVYFSFSSADLGKNSFCCLLVCVWLFLIEWCHTRPQAPPRRRQIF